MGKTRTIAVVGATGQQGGSVARAILEKGHIVRALTRSTDSPAAQQIQSLGAKLVQTDLTDRNLLIQAFNKVDAVFGVTTPFETGVELETVQGINIVEAAREANVGHFIFSSVGKADADTGIPHFDSKYKVEQYLLTAGVPHTIIGPVFFMENWFSPWFLPPIKEGNVALAMPGDRKLAQVSVDDIGRFVALIFQKPEEFIGKRLDIASDDVTGKEVAEKIGNQIGRKLGYFRIPIEAIREQSEDFALMFEWFDRVGYNVDVNALKRDYPEVGWTSFDQWVGEQDWSDVTTSLVEKEPTTAEDGEEHRTAT